MKLKTFLFVAACVGVMAAEATAFGPQSYVKRGCVAMFDGEWNCRDAEGNLSHSGDQTKWYNLVNGAAATWSSKGTVSVGAKYYYFNGGKGNRFVLAMPGFRDSARNGYTVELMAEYASLEQLGVGAKIGTGMYFQNKCLTYTTSTGQCGGWKATAANTIVGGAVVYDSGYTLGGSLPYYNGLLTPKSTVTYSGNYRPADEIQLGNYSDSHAAVGKLYAARFYNRRLSAGEVALNNAIDTVRFKGKSESSVAWPDGYRFAADGTMEYRVRIELAVAGVGSVTVMKDGEPLPSGEVWVANGETAEFTATASGEGFEFAAWDGDSDVIGSVGSASIAFTADHSLTLKARFQGNAVWTGAGTDTKMSTAANWKSDITPYLGSGCLQAFFAEGGASAIATEGMNFLGLTITNGFTLAESAQAISLGRRGLFAADDSAAKTYEINAPLNLTESQSWRIGTNATVNLRKPISAETGVGLTVSGRGRLNLYAPSTNPNPVTISGCSAQAAKGDGKIETVYLYTNNAFGLGKLTVDVRRTQLRFVGDYTNTAAVVTSCDENDWHQNTYFDGNLVFNGDFEHTSKNTAHTFHRGKTVIFNGMVKTASANYCATLGESGYADVIYNKKLSIGDRYGIPQWLRVTLNAPTNRINGNAGTQAGVIRCGVPYALDYHNGSGSGTFVYPTAGLTIDLNGFDQGVGCIFARSGGGKVTSARPATLHLVDNYMIPDYDTGMKDAAGNKIAAPGYTNFMTFTGCASFSKEGKYTNRLVKVSSTYGDLTVLKSRLEFAPGASWLNASNLTVKGTGLFTLDNRTAAQGQPFGKQLDLHVEGELAKVELNNTIPAVVRYFEIDGARQPEGVYYGSSAAKAANPSLNVTVKPCFTGSGLVFSRGIPGLMLFLR